MTDKGLCTWILPYSMGSGVLPQGKAAEACRWPLTSTSAEVQETVEICFIPNLRIHVVYKAFFIFTFTHGKQQI